jgi:hypothetical protein
VFFNKEEPISAIARVKGVTGVTELILGFVRYEV